MGLKDIDQRQREEARWRILRVLDAGRPLGCSEDLVWRALNDVKLTLSVRDVRRELTYLRDLELVVIDAADDEAWRAALTAAGVDVVEYVAPAPAGVARPPRW
jgi:hypothetical protein